MTRLSLIALAASATLLVACEREYVPHETAVATPSSVTVRSVTPDPEQPLTIGQEVTVSMDVSYTIGVAAGHIGVIVQTAEGEVLSEQVSPVVRGEHSAQMQVAFTVPDTDAVHVVVPVSERGRAATSDVQIITYEVDR